MVIFVLFPMDNLDFIFKPCSNSVMADNRNKKCGFLCHGCASTNTSFTGGLWQAIPSFFSNTNTHTHTHNSEMVTETSNHCCSIWQFAIPWLSFFKWLPAWTSCWQIYEPSDALQWAMARFPLEGIQNVSESMPWENWAVSVNTGGPHLQLGVCVSAD